MVLDSLKSHRMIGIIQPKNNNNDFFMMGCIGKNNFLYRNTRLSTSAQS
jgi:hypothetical protein